ncbi:MAG: SUMF1/EgtB/PvdO family nonheme iron enzyme [Caldilineaceae bacterium]
MSNLDYLDFELEIGQPTGQNYPLTVLRSPAGEARATLAWPLGELALENRLKDLQIALLSSGGVRRTVLSPAEEAVQRFGAELFDLLFTGEVRNRYDVSQERVHHQGKGLRVKLRIQDPRLANLPWEFLYDSRRDGYICLSHQTPLVRYLELPQTIRPLAVTPPLRILGMIASPSDLQALDIRVEQQRLERAIAPLQAKGLVQLHWLEGATWRDLQRTLRREQWHLFHFVGHGSFDPRRDEGLIAFCNDANQAHLLTASDLGRLLADHRTLRLAVLNACLGAQGSNRDLFASTAATLVRRGIVAVVAMQQAITDAAAIEFTGTFYESLADGLPVDAAMGEARKAISLAVTNTLEWGTPVLYSRASDGVLFTVVLPSTSIGNDNSPLTEREPVQAESVEVKPVEAKPIASTYLLGKGGVDLQNQQMPVAPSHKADDVHPGVTEKVASVSRWRQLRLLTSLFVVGLLFGTFPFWPQWATLFGPDAGSKPLDAAKVAVTTPTQVTSVALLSPATLTPTSTVNGDATAAAIATATTIAIQIATNEAATLTVLPTATFMPTNTPTFVSTPTPAAGSRYILASLPITFVYVPAGSFIMGGPKGISVSDRQPQHTMTVDAFWIGLTEVTNVQYQYFIDNDGYNTPDWWTDAGWKWRTEKNITEPEYWDDEKWKGPKQPVVGVSWYEATAYVMWLADKTGLDIRLPAEAQWEKAARGSNGRLYPWGDELPNNRLLNFNNKVGRTVDVGSYLEGASPYKALDMAGNVYEWTSTKWIGNYENYVITADDDKQGDAKRSLRGGSWGDFPTSVQSANRGWGYPVYRNYFLGFRLIIASERPE